MSFINNLILKNGLKNKRYFRGRTSKDYVGIRKEEVQQVRFVRKPKNVIDEVKTIAGVTVHQISKPENPQDKVILYIHGGAFVTGSSDSKTMFTYHLVDKFGYNLISIDYRLAPEHPFPAGVNDCIDVYAEVIQKYGAKNVILLGESAGANLVLVTLLKIKERGYEYPKASFAFSPCVQYDKELGSYITNQNTEGMVTNLSDEVKAVYICSDNEIEVKNPFAAPLYGDFSGCTPIYLFASRTETLFDDSILMYQKLKNDHVPVSLFLRNNVVHTWVTIPVIPEAQKDLKVIHRLIDTAFKADPEVMLDVIELR